MIKRKLGQEPTPNTGFTLLEVMIAVAIFGFLMLYVSQFMKLQIGTYNQASRENDLEQKARIAVMHILDEVRLHKYTLYQTGSSPEDTAHNDGRGIYYYTDPLNRISAPLVDLEPGDSPKANIYYDRTEESQGNGKLYYQVPHAGEPSTLDRYLIADRIISFDMRPVDENDPSLLKLDIKVGISGGSGGAYAPQPYELVTWIRVP